MQGTIRGLAAHWIAVAALVVLLAMPAAADAAFPGANGKIAFTQSGIGIKVVNPDGSGEVTLREGNSPDWSADGSAIAFVNRGVWRMPADGSSQTLVVRDEDDVISGPCCQYYTEPSWSPDGSRIAVYWLGSLTGELFEDVRTVKSDGAGGHQGVASSATRPSWSPGGDRIAFIEAHPEFTLHTIRVDGTDRKLIFDGQVEEVDWSPDGTRLVFSTRGASSDVYVIPSGGGTPTQLTSNPAADTNPAWSPDGSQIVFSSNRDGDYEIYRMNVDGSNVTQVTHNTVNDFSPDWQPVVTGYPRPKGAGPLRVPLVTAFRKCDTPGFTPNRTHGPPLEHPSCNPPLTISPAKVGTPDSGTGAANSVGVVRYQPLPGTPGGVDDADLALSLNVTDVRCRHPAAAPVLPCGSSNDVGTPEDYAGELSVSAGVRLTDRAAEAATLSDLLFSFTAPCAGTPDTSIGSTCAISTTADAVLPGAITEGGRATWALGKVTVFDGGPDGDAETTEGNLGFLTQGIFVP